MQPNVCTIRKVKDDMTTLAPPRPPPKNGLPPEIMEIILPALQVGGLSGASGVFVGTFAGIIRSNTPVLFAMASGIQWFTLGTSFTLSRNVVLHAWGKDKVTPQDKISASAIGGGVGGTVGGLLRGRGNVIPGAIVFALFGAAGQYFYNRADTRRSNYIEEPSSDTKGSWLNSKWSPMKVLSDKEYGDMLQEKLLRVNAEIALLDESIENLRVQEREMNKTVESQNKSGAR